MNRATCVLTALMVLATPIRMQAGDALPKPLPAAEVKKGTLIDGMLHGDESDKFVVSASAGQTLSVDLLSSNPSANFNITPAGGDEAIFMGAVRGTVADVPLPKDGDYVIEVFLERAAARREETSDFTIGITLNGADFADSLAGGPDYWAVSGLSGGDALNVRSGPALRYPAIGQLNNGQILQNRGCRLTIGTRWCNIRATGSGLAGWVAGRYLIESAAPATPEGGPVGNGVPFDATGALPCAMSEAQPMRDCPFGVVRDGPGNAGVWIATSTGTERQILFEGGKPVSANVDADVSFSKTDDLFRVTVGAERYEIPEAVISGG